MKKGGRAEGTDDILYGELEMLQPAEGEGPRVCVDTVLLAHFARRVKPRARVAEPCCAHGAVSLIMARRRELSARGGEAPPIEAFDIDARLTAMAKKNAERNGLTDRVSFFTLDLREARSRFRAETFDAVVMNPPYDEPGTGNAPSSEAMARAAHGSALTLAEAVAGAKYLLKNGGRLFIVMRANRAGELMAELAAKNVRPKRMIAVHPRPGREAAFVLIEAARASGPGLVIEPPLFIYGPDGEYTQELLAAYRMGE